MILNEKTYKLESSDDFSKTDFKIDPRYKNKIMWMLINQYRYKVRTPVQEIISNARDAQRENGNPDTPIKIILPTRLETTFKVRDYGVGMDENRIKTIFASIGASTKNNSNEQTGGFGIGAKSPLAYTDQFNIKTFVDGTYWLYVVAKTQEGGISIHLLGKGKTDEPNGTEVQIPVNPNDRHDFIKAACRTTMFWEVQPIFNLEAEDLYTATNETRLNRISLYARNDLGNLFNEDLIVCVDGIPYPIDYDTKRKVKVLEEISNKVNGTAVIRLNVGDIDLLQTRENIDETENTITKLRKYGLEALTAIEEYLASCYTAKDLQGRIAQHKDLCKKFREIRPHQFSKVFSIDEISLGLSNKFRYYGYTYKGKWGSRTKTAQKKDNGFWGTRISYDQLNNVYWDDLGDSESSHSKARKLKYALEQSGSSEIRVIEKHNASNFEWVRTLRVLGIKKLSSLPMPPKKVRVKGTTKKKDKKPNYITVHKVYDSGGKYSSDINYTTNSTKFVYVDYQDEFNGWQIVINKYTEFTAIKLSKAVQKIIKDDTNFITFEAFKANFKSSQSLIKASLSNYASSIKIKGKKIEALKLAKPFIFDRILLKSLNLYDNINFNYDSEFKYIPEEVKAMLDKMLDAKMQGIANRVSRLIERLDRYPMIERVNMMNITYEYNNRRKKKSEIAEGRKIADYINTVYLVQTRRRL